MTTIKATCPTCGEVTLTADDIDLRVDPAGLLDAFYAFTCPACICVVRKPADERVVRLLATGGVAAQPHEATPPAPQPRFRTPPLTHDDLLDFHALLDTADWFAQVCDLVRQAPAR